MKIIIADSSSESRERIKIALSEIQDIVVAVETSDGETTLNTIHNYSPDMVMLNLHLPKKNGVEIITSVREHYPEMKILVFAETYDAKLWHKAYTAGADYIFDKETNFNEMIDVVRLLADMVEV